MLLRCVVRLNDFPAFMSWVKLIDVDRVVGT